MRVYHPQGMYNNIPPENVFLAADEMGNEIGVGYIIRVMQPNVFPDRPVNLFISMECQPVARYMLFGALVARARQMRDENPQLKARVYTAISPGDARTKEFYLHNGFTCEDTEDMLRLEIPAGDGKIPMSCAVAPVPLNTPEEQNAFIYRLVMNDITFMDVNYLQGLMRMPHFLALGLYRNTDLIGEIVMAGEGESCELSACTSRRPTAARAWDGRCCTAPWRLWLRKAYQGDHPHSQPQHTAKAADGGLPVPVAGG